MSALTSEAARMLALFDLIDAVTPLHYAIACAGAVVLCAWACASVAGWIKWWRHVNP